MLLAHMHHGCLLGPKAAATFVLAVDFSYPTVSQYGHGDWNQYVVGLLYLLGWVISALVVLGIGRLLWRATIQKAWRSQLFRVELLLIYGSAGVFIAAHTVFWVFGLFGSAGLTRVLAMLPPLLAIVALRGLSCLVALGRTAQVQQRIAIGVAALAIVFLFTGLRMSLRWQRDFGLPGDLALAEQAATWYRQQPGRQGQPVALEHPGIARALGVDVFDRRARPLASSNKQLLLRQLPLGTIIFWDDWFSTVEGGLSAERLANDPHFRQRWAGRALRHPGDPGDGYCQLRIFEKIR